LVEVFRGSPGGELQEQNKDPRIPTVIRELSQSARELADPRLLTLQSKAEPSSLQAIGYKSADNLKWLELNKAYFQMQMEDPAAFTLPKRLQEYERVIPVFLRKLHDPKGPVTDLSGKESSRGTLVWVTLDTHDPQAFMLMKEDGEAITFDDDLTGQEKVMERPDLLPHILEAVSGVWTDPRNRGMQVGDHNDALLIRRMVRRGEATRNPDGTYHIKGELDK
jgi:hypothetical protein